MSTLKQQKMKSLWHQLLVVLGGTIILMMIAFHNHYPLLSLKSSNSILKTFGDYSAMSNSIFYDLFVNQVSLKESLWYVTYVQNFIIAFVLYRFIASFQWKNKNIIYLIISAVLMFFTSISWYSNHIAPEIFVGTGLLIMYIFYLRPVQKFERFILIILLFFATISQNFNAFVYLLFGIAFLIYGYKTKRYKQEKKQIATVFVTIALGFATLITADQVLNKKSAIFSSLSDNHQKQLVENGLAYKILNDHCNDLENIHLCKINKLDTIQSLKQLEKAFKKGRVKKGNEFYAELSKIQSLSFSKPAYFIDYFEIVTISFFEQLLTFRIDNPIQNRYKKYDIAGALHSHIRYEKNEFSNSKQYDYYYKVKNPNQYRSRLMLITARKKEFYGIFVLLIALTIIHFSVKIKTMYLNLFKLFIIFLLINSFILIIFSEISYANTGKIIWIPVLLLSIIILKEMRLWYSLMIRYLNKLNNNNSNNENVL